MATTGAYWYIKQEERGFVDCVAGKKQGQIVKGFNGCWVLEKIKDFGVWFILWQLFRKSLGHLLGIKYCLRHSDSAI